MMMMMMTMMVMMMVMMMMTRGRRTTSMSTRARTRMLTHIWGGDGDKGIVDVAGVEGAGVHDPLAPLVEDVAARRGAVAVEDSALDLQPPNKNPFHPRAIYTIRHQVTLGPRTRL
jgi:hypothetical protein